MTDLIDHLTNTDWQVTPTTGVGLVSSPCRIEWRVERNDTDRRVFLRLTTLFATRDGAEAICAALNNGDTPHTLGMRCHLLPE